MVNCGGATFKSNPLILLTVVLKEALKAGEHGMVIGGTSSRTEIFITDPIEGVIKFIAYQRNQMV